MSTTGRDGEGWGGEGDDETTNLAMTPSNLFCVYDMYTCIYVYTRNAHIYRNTYTYTRMF